MEQNGFNRYIIWNCLDTVLIKQGDREISILEWMQRERSKSDLNHRPLIQSLKRSGFDPIELKIRQEILRYHNRIQALSGGGQGPMASRSGGAIPLFHHSPIQARSAPEFELGLTELNDQSSHLGAEPGLGFDSETGLHVHAPEPSFAQAAASSTDVFANSSSRSEGLHSSATETQSSHSNQIWDQETGNTNTRYGQDVNHQPLQHETVKDILTSDIKSSLKDDIKTAASDKINQYTSFNVDYSSNTYTLYDGKHFDLNVTFSIDGTINPQLQRTPGNPKDASITLEGSNLDFNITFGVSYTKESYMFADYDIKLEGTVSSDITLTLHKEPDQRGISDVTLGANGLTFTIYAGLIDSLDYSGPMVDITFDPSIEWSFNLSRADGLTIDKPDVDLGLDIHFNDPLLALLEEGIGYLEEGFGYLEEGLDYVDSFMQGIYNDAAKYLEQGVDYTISEIKGGLDDAANYVDSKLKSGWDDLVNGAENTWNDLSSGAQSAWNSTTSWVSSLW